MKPTPIRRSKRATVRTPELRAHEALGLALGRLAMASQEFRDDFQRGFTLAMKEDSLGRKRDHDAACRGALAAGAELVRVYLDEPARRRRRARPRLPR